MKAKSTTSGKNAKKRRSPTISQAGARKNANALAEAKETIERLKDEVVRLNRECGDATIQLEEMRNRWEDALACLQNVRNEVSDGERKARSDMEEQQNLLAVFFVTGGMLRQQQEMIQVFQETRDEAKNAKAIDWMRDEAEKKRGRE